MQFFKHYNNMDSSTFIQKVIKKHGLLGYAHWNLLLELMCLRFNGESILVQLTVPEVASKLRIKSARVHSIISSFSELGNNQVITKLESNNNQDNFDGFIIIISAPILVDLQDRDFKYSRKERVEDDAKKEELRTKKKELRNKNKISNIHEKFSDDFLNPYLAKVKIETQEAWIKAYVDSSWIKIELIKAATWLINKGIERKNMGQYLTNWLNNAAKTKGTAKKSMSGYAEEMFKNNPYDCEVVA